MRNKDVLTLKEILETEIEINKNNKEFVGIYLNVEAGETKKDPDNIIITTVLDNNTDEFAFESCKYKEYKEKIISYEKSLKEYVEYGKHLRVKFQKIQISRILSNARHMGIDGMYAFPGREERERNNIINAIIICDKSDNIKKAQMMTEDNEVLNDKEKQTPTEKILIHRFKNNDCYLNPKKEKIIH